MKANNKKIYVSGLLLVIIILSAGLAQAASLTTKNTTSAASTQSSSGSGPTNIVIDYSSTSIDSNLGRGASGILTLAIKNTGSMDAKNVEVWLPTAGAISLDKRFTIGTIDAGATKSMQALVRVGDNANIGLNVIQARVSFDGYETDGSSKDNQLVVLEVPFRVYGSPAFQIKPTKTTYYKDTVEDLSLEITVKDAVKDLQTTIESNCITVIGSSQKQVGDISSNQKTTVVYSIKPTASGSCQSTLNLDYNDVAGQDSLATVTFGLNIASAGVDFKIINISYDQTGPGEKVSVKTIIKNVGDAEAEDVTLTLDLSDPFTTADTSEKYVGVVGGGETIEETFNLAISWDAETKVYSVPLQITYKVGGTSYAVEKDLGIDVGGQVILEVIKVTASGSSLKIDVANMGTRSADSVKGTLIVGDGARFTTASFSSATQTQAGGQGGNPLSMLTGGGRRQNTDASTQTSTQTVPQMQGNRTGNASATIQQYISYKSDIKATKQTTFTFDTMISGTATLVLEYTGANSKRITQRIPITVGSASAASSSTRTMAARGGTDTTTYIIYAAVAVIVLFVGYKLYKKRKNRN